MDSRATLAVAGSGKTAALVDHCRSAGTGGRILVATFTKANQDELRRRLSRHTSCLHSVEVTGWYAFLLRHFAKPFIPFKFDGRRVLGFNYDGAPHRFAKGTQRFLDSRGAVYACELGRLASDLIAESDGALLRRLECCYDQILVDEVQDLTAYDWEVLDRLLRSRISVWMVGDLRQAILSTTRSSKNKQYAHSEAIRWFVEREREGLLKVTEQRVTWRCRPEIAAFADSIFDSSCSFPTTESRNTMETGHDGVFLVHPDDIEAYVERYEPRCLRHGATSGSAYDLEYLNFGAAKGLAFDRVLVLPTGPIEKFLRKGEYLGSLPASRFYVAVTRARQSVALVIGNPGNCALPRWKAAPVQGGTALLHEGF